GVGGPGSPSGRAGGGRGTGSGGQSAASGGTATHGAVRGVTSNSVTIGVATLDLSAVKYLGPEYDNGDVAGQWNAMVADWRDRHLLPVNGRDVALKFVSYSVLNTDDQRRACAALVDDDQSFAVVAPEFFYQTGADRVARDLKTRWPSASSRRRAWTSPPCSRRREGSPSRPTPSATTPSTSRPTTRAARPTSGRTPTPPTSTTAPSP